MRRFASQISKIFWGLCPQSPIPGSGYSAPPETSPARRSGALLLPRLFRGLRPLHRPPTRNAGSTLWKSWLRLCALTICHRKWGSSFPKKIGARPPPHHPHKNLGSATDVAYRCSAHWVINCSHYFVSILGFAIFVCICLKDVRTKWWYAKITVCVCGPLFFRQFDLLNWSFRLSSIFGLFATGYQQTIGAINYY